MTGIENAVASCCLEGRDPENSIAGEMIALLLELVLKIASRLLAAPPFLSSLCSPGDGGEIPGVPPPIDLIFISLLCLVLCHDVLEGLLLSS